jgi:hypothetical protein
MKKLVRGRFCPLAVAIALGACSHSGATGALPPASDGASAVSPAVASASQSHGATTVAITLPPIHPKGQPIDWSEVPNQLSSATQSVSGTIGKQAFGPIALSSSQSSCTTGKSGTVCTVTIDAKPASNVPILVRTFGKKTTDVAVALASGTSTQSIFKGQSNAISPTMFGVAHRFAVQPLQKTLTQGFAAPDRLAIYGVDAASTAIPSCSLLNADLTPLTKYEVSFAGPTPQVKYQQQTCGLVATFTYDGVGTGTETITAKAKSGTEGSGTVVVTPGTTTLATLLTVGQSTIPQSTAMLTFVEEFRLTANGNVAPIRTMIPNYGRGIFDGGGVGSYFGEDAKGNFWAGNSRLSNRGAVLGTVDYPTGTPQAADPEGRVYTHSDDGGQQCAITEYPAKTYGSPKAVREIDIPSCQNYLGVTVDRAGNVYVTMRTASSSTIVEYPATGSGSMAPSRTIVLPVDANTMADVDDSGNVYLLGTNTTPGSNALLYKVPPGSTTGTQILSGVALQSFAVDGAGNIYAFVYAGVPGAPRSIQYFRAGATSPSRSITGSNTLLRGYAVVMPR